MALSGGCLTDSFAAHVDLVAGDPLVGLFEGLDQPGIYGAAWNCISIPVLVDDHTADPGAVYRFG